MAIRDVTSAGIVTQIKKVYDVSTAGIVTQIKKVQDVDNYIIKNLVYTASFAAVDKIKWSSLSVSGVANVIKASEGLNSKLFGEQPGVGYTASGNLGMSISATSGRRHWLHVYGGKYGDSGGNLKIKCWGYEKTTSNQTEETSEIVTATGNSTFRVTCDPASAQYAVLIQADIIDVEELFEMGFTKSEILAFMNSNCRGKSGTIEVFI